MVPAGLEDDVQRMILCDDDQCRRHPPRAYLFGLLARGHGVESARDILLRLLPFSFLTLHMSTMRLGAFGWLSWALAAAAAQFESFSPSAQSDLTYSVHVPNGTASSGSGPIYFQINATLPLTWVALGQGTHMAGANIFVVYSNAAGDNVTVSPRLGKGHVQPVFNPNAKISVMEGSGIGNGVMTANVRCDSCLQWDGGSMDPTNSGSPWVWAVKYGKPLQSDNSSATISKHDEEGDQVLDLTKATGNRSANPFAELSRSSAVAASASSAVGGGGRGGEYWAFFNRRVTAHAALLIIPFVILYPLSALTIYFFPSLSVMKMHAPLQVFNTCLVIAGMGLGISIAKDINKLDNYHPIIGLVVISTLLAFQPAMGYLQHRYFRKTGRKSVFAFTHRWLGRTLIVLGIINVGLGFRLAGIGVGNPTGAVIAYGVVAGVFALFYLLVVVIVGWRRRNRE